MVLATRLLPVSSNFIIAPTSRQLTPEQRKEGEGEERESVGVPEVLPEHSAVVGRSGAAAGSRALLLGHENASLALSVDLHTDGAVVSKAAVLEGVLVGEVVGLSAEQDAIAPDQEAVVLLDKLPSKLLRHVCW